jgi:hypothetical protein
MICRLTGGFRDLPIATRRSGIGQPTSLANQSTNQDISRSTDD